MRLFRPLDGLGAHSSISNMRCPNIYPAVYI